MCIYIISWMYVLYLCLTWPFWLVPKKFCQDLWKKVIETHVNEEKEEVLEEAKLEAEPGPPRCWGLEIRYLHLQPQWDDTGPSTNRAPVLAGTEGQELLDYHPCAVAAGAGGIFGRIAGQSGQMAPAAWRGGSESSSDSLRVYGCFQK